MNNKINKQQLINSLAQLNIKDLKDFVNCALTITSKTTGKSCTKEHYMQLGTSTRKDLDELFFDNELTLDKVAALLIGAIGEIKQINPKYRLKDLIDNSFLCHSSTQEQREQQEAKETSWSIPTPTPDKQKNPNSVNPFL